MKQTAALLIALSLGLTACKGPFARLGGGAPSASVQGEAAIPESRLREAANAWGQRFQADKTDRVAALNYAAALDMLDRKDTAVAVLEQAAIRNPEDKTVLAAYGKALNKVGRSDQALKVLSNANVVEAPDWKVLSAKGVSLDQLGEHAAAQEHYEEALKIAPSEPKILSNYGLSLALSEDVTRAETLLRRASARSQDERVWRNLALVLELQGKTSEADAINARFGDVG